MPEPRPVLARIIAAHAGVGPGKANLSDPLKTGLTRAIRRAALPFGGLLPRIGDVAVTSNTTLTIGAQALPDHALLAAIEDEDGRRGLIALDHALIDALIEVQSTGRVEDGDLPLRPVTRIDEALCRDFLDLILSAFAKETAEETARDWPDRMSYGSRIEDRGQLNLLLPEQGYHLLKTAVTAAGRKTGDLLLLLPVDAASARRRVAALSPGPQATPVDWSARLLRALGAAPMALDAVLMRKTMPLGRVEALAPGDLIAFQRADLAAVTLEGEGDHIFARGTLGQLGGLRAVRFAGTGTGAGAEADAAPAPPPAQPGMAGGMAGGLAGGMVGVPTGGPVAGGSPPGLMPASGGLAVAGGALATQAVSAPGSMAPHADATPGGSDPDAPMW